MKEFDYVIVGGGPAGFNAVKAIKDLSPEASVLVVSKDKQLQIPCAVPYVLCGKIPVDKNAYPLEKMVDFGAELLIDKVVSIDTSSSKVFFASGESAGYKKLILATGWKPRKLGIEGEELDGIYNVLVDRDSVLKLKQEVDAAKKILLVGAGFTSLEIADLLREEDKEITIVEIMDHVAAGMFSPDLEKTIVSGLKGVNILTQTSVKAFYGSNGRVKKALLSDGTEIDVDLVIVSIGFLPNSDLAAEAGIKLDERGFVQVDRFLRTSCDEVFAAGNCARHICRIDASFTPAMMASVAARDGKVAGVNAVSPQIIDKGVVPAGVTESGGMYFGFAGYTERNLKRKGLKYEKVEVVSSDAYPMAIKGASKFKMIAYFLRDGRFIGMEIEGRSRIVTDFVTLSSFVIGEEKRAEDIVDFVSIAFPALTPSPLGQPLQEAALEVMKRI